MQREDNGKSNSSFSIIASLSPAHILRSPFGVRGQEEGLSPNTRVVRAVGLGGIQGGWEFPGSGSATPTQASSGTGEVQGGLVKWPLVRPSGSPPSSSAGTPRKALGDCSLSGGYGVSSVEFARFSPLRLEAAPRSRSVASSFMSVPEHFSLSSGEER